MSNKNNTNNNNSNNPPVVRELFNNNNTSGISNKNINQIELDIPRATIKLQNLWINIKEMETNIHNDDNIKLLREFIHIYLKKHDKTYIQGLSDYIYQYLIHFILIKINYRNQNINNNYIELFYNYINRLDRLIYSNDETNIAKHDRLFINTMIASILYNKFKNTGITNKYDYDKEKDEYDIDHHYKNIDQIRLELFGNGIFNSLLENFSKNNRINDFLNLFEMITKQGETYKLSENNYISESIIFVILLGCALFQKYVKNLDEVLEGNFFYRYNFKELIEDNNQINLEDIMQEYDAILKNIHFTFMSKKKRELDIPLELFLQEVYKNDSFKSIALDNIYDPNAIFMPTIIHDYSNYENKIENNINKLVNNLATDRNIIKQYKEILPAHRFRLNEGKSLKNNPHSNILNNTKKYKNNKKMYKRSMINRKSKKSLGNKIRNTYRRLVGRNNKNKSTRKIKKYLETYEQQQRIDKNNYKLINSGKNINKQINKVEDELKFVFPTKTKEKIRRNKKLTHNNIAKAIRNSPFRSKYNNFLNSKKDYINSIVNELKKNNNKTINTRLNQIIAHQKNNPEIKIALNKNNIKEIKKRIKREKRKGKSKKSKQQHKDKNGIVRRNLYNMDKPIPENMKYNMGNMGNNGNKGYHKPIYENNNNNPVIGNIGTWTTTKKKYLPQNLNDDYNYNNNNNNPASANIGTWTTK